MPERKRVTVVNDNPEFLQLMQDLLQDASYPATLISGDRENATELIRDSEPEVLIIDLRLGSDEMKGLDILRWTREHPVLRHVPAIVCTADSWGVESVQAELKGYGNVSVLVKPFSVDQLYGAMSEVASAR
jgi:CheY-like chemotaxis protein